MEKIKVFASLGRDQEERTPCSQSRRDERK